MQPFKVKIDDAKNFAKVWTYKGIAIVLDEQHAQFAADYANVVLRNFIEMQVANFQAKKKAEEEAAKPKVTLA